ncbi:adenosylmethionine--8-amino-7-oxononanoate transaminase [Paraliomyxa miuraensis]|uniref:adenosylmethionine--8-amino-7-oxononanoate transaminase n=1 Tax=Paraliomyxa miuraensis TaxID=376150 RepID=UPI00224CD01F|nr:adenosylmethionine--8-amino-7-oxononanoate transaminase [Paraliomyxa miuraensis]MCX4239347.1 adenosylmethionine--8-amino-7-oxononanoate transaminase [Paraliomyxa miuraensis]
MDDWLARDARVLWHPATHLDDLDRLPICPIEAAQGVWLVEAGGRRILDAIGSWWTSIHGHGHPRIVAAIREQVGRLDHVMFAGFTHAPAIELAEALVRAAPAGYGKVFFADCGSAAVEVALKLSFQAHQQRGEPGRTRFAALTHGYHGETLGALSVSGTDAYRRTFAPLLVEPIYMSAPELPDHRVSDLPEDGGGEAGADTPEAEAAVALLHAHASELAALVVEPLVQCASRMRMTGVGFYRRITREAQRLGIHVIADEIAVAFGRTGRLFASEHAGVRPDLMCLSKGLSGGVLPLAAVLVRAGFEDDFRGSPARSFLHSHTFTANPIACAAGRASLAVLRSEGTLARLPERIAAMARRREAVAERCPAVVHHRQAGMIAALEVGPRPGRAGVADGRLGLALREAAMRRGVLLRPLHDTIYWMPALDIDDEALDVLAEVTAEVIEEVLG